jgi:hypothetical protein
MQARARRKKYYFKLAIFNVAVLVVLLVLVEGLASYAIVAQRLFSTRPLAERLHTEYDRELGWVNKQSTHVPGIYGPGASLTTNSQRFRSDRDFTEAVPPGKLRAICSGDSFTLGYGVDDRRTWCQLLSTLEPRLETLNMGQGGYGVDQTYLWYMRDGLRFEHHFHIVALITEDFYRMQSDSFLGYGKPMLDLANDTLVVKNVPVPQPSGYQIWLSNVARRAKELRSVDLAARAVQRVGWRPEASPASRRVEDDEKIRRVLAKVFENLAKLHRAHARRLVVVYIPVQSELKGDGANNWIRFIETTTQALDIQFINIVESFRTLSPAEATGMFIPEGVLAHSEAAGHLTDRGNQRVAEIVHESLTAGNSGRSPE